MNAQIEEARQVVLKLLQPSERDLEHGLQLHRESLVFESYGFSPAAAIEGGASESEVKEMREDMTMTRKATNPEDRAEMLAAWDAAGVTCIFQNASQSNRRSTVLSPAR